MGKQATVRLDMRATPQQAKRIALLMEKKGVTSRTSVVMEAVKQMYDREFPPKEKSR